MNILVHTDNHVAGSAEFISEVESSVRDALRRFADWLTRVEVQLGEESGHPTHGDQSSRCVIEARPSGHQPMAVTHHAATLDQALEGACRKLVRVLDDTAGRLSAEHRGG